MRLRSEDGKVWLVGAAAVALIGLARFVNPSAPPVYDGIPLPNPPYRYVSPPPDLASSNKKPLDGRQTWSLSATSGTVETGDRQVVAFFAKGTIPAGDATSVTVTITPVESPPPPPAGATYIGNVYAVSGFGEPGHVAITTLMGSGGQVLMRVPPVTFTGVVLRGSDGTWRPVQWGPQPDFVNLSLDRFGMVAAIDVPRATPAAGPGGHLTASLVPVAGLVVILGVLVAVLYSRRRARGA